MLDKKRLLMKWSIAIKIAPILIIVIIMKFIIHFLGYEIMALNALFTSVVAGTIFLLGFLISGVLTDYKESEKIPSEYAASLESLYDVTYKIYKGKNSNAAKEFIIYQKKFITSMFDWFYKREKTQSIFDKISGMNEFLIRLEDEGVQGNFIIKMENEQNNIRKLLLRTHTIRDTNFIASGYAIVEALGIAIAIGMIIIKIEPFFESFFFTVLVTFLVTYMIFLIKDLDNPFDYAIHGETGTEVPLKPLRDFAVRLNEFDI
jgi:hypothetical protein